MSYCRVWGTLFRATCLQRSQTHIHIQGPPYIHRSKALHKLRSMEPLELQVAPWRSSNFHGIPKPEILNPLWGPCSGSVLVYGELLSNPSLIKFKVQGLGILTVCLLEVLGGERVRRPHKYAPAGLFLPVLVSGLTRQTSE